MLHWYYHRMALFVVIVYSIIKYGACWIEPALFNCCVYIKQWPLAGEFVEFEYSPKIRQIFVTRSGEFGEY